MSLQQYGYSEEKVFYNHSHSLLSALIFPTGVVVDREVLILLGTLATRHVRSLQPGTEPVLSRSWATSFRRRHKMSRLRRCTTDRPVSTVSDICQDNEWRVQVEEVVCSPADFGIILPDLGPTALPQCMSPFTCLLCSVSTSSCRYGDGNGRDTADVWTACERHLRA